MKELDATKPSSSITDKPQSFYQRWVMRYRKLWLSLIILCILIWAVIPAFRAYTLVANLNRSKPAIPADVTLPLKEIHFSATDGIHLAGWLAIASPDAPTIILVHGFKGDRLQMVSRAKLLYTGGYNVLLYDSRGCGESEGWKIDLGANEAKDEIGAVHYLQKRSDLRNKHFGAIGISLGAGIVLLAAAQESALEATIADSAWIDETAQTSRMNTISGLPLLPYEAPLVDALIGAHLADTKPLAVINQIAPRAVMIIHSADDANTTTPLMGARQLYQAAKEPKELWIVPHGGHTGGINAYPEDYKAHVLSFFAAHLTGSPAS